MKPISPKNIPVVTILSFALIPLSGLATDVYLPSLPAMATYFGVDSKAMQASLLIFLVSGGVSQLFVGSLLDSFGRFRLSSAALVLFALASFTIATTDSLLMLNVMRGIQGVSVAFIVVAKRAYFMDTFSGDRLKNYTSLFSIIWATAPIVAPFIGGYLQTYSGWRANFYFLGAYTLLILALDLKFGGESLKTFKSFKARPILETYAAMYKTADFSLSLTMIALSYSMLMVFGMTSPFIIEHVYHYSPVITGYSALFSGLTLMTGGIISKSIIRVPLAKKVPVTIGLQVVFAGGMLLVSQYVASNLFTLLVFVGLLNVTGGFLFNNFFAYCLQRFAGNAGIVSGLTGGSLFVLTSVLSYGLVSVLGIQSQVMLGIAYLVFIAGNVFAFTAFRRMHATANDNVSLKAA